MASLSKGKLNSVCATLWQREFNIRWEHCTLILFIIYIIHLCEKDCTVLQVCWAVEPRFQEQKFQLPRIPTAQTIAELHPACPKFQTFILSVHCSYLNKHW